MTRKKQSEFQGGKLVRSFRAAASGFGQALRTEQNLRIHLIVTVGVIMLGWWLGMSPVEWLLVAICVGVVITTELMNTAVEYLCDVVRDKMKLDYEATKLPRDMAAAAVLVSSIMAVGVGLAVFGLKLVFMVHSWIS